ncbi:hypothetical protein [Okeania sp. SIO2G5]|uniref:hypothetical protein n=1 Tax=Okeania sp. SIO2G5 TaxID=2607796 RepID=UPI0025809F3D|nr:hypothetical protein [Okeania sp. SIO2G5]
MTYKTQAADTTIEADKKYFELLGKVFIETKIKQYIITNRKVYYSLFPIPYSLALYNYQ